MAKVVAVTPGSGKTEQHAEQFGWSMDRPIFEMQSIALQYMPALGTYNPTSAAQTPQHTNDAEDAVHVCRTGSITKYF